MKTIKMVVLAILAMMFTAVAFPAMAADQQVKKPQVQKVSAVKDQKQPMDRISRDNMRLAKDCSGKDCEKTAKPLPKADLVNMWKNWGK